MKPILDASIASVRAFGAILASVCEEDPEGAKVALEVASGLAADLVRWQDFAYDPSDAALFRVSGMMRSRMATTSLTAYDAKLLGDLCARASALSGVSADAPQMKTFSLACRDVERAWHDETPRS